MIKLDIISDIACPWCYVGKGYLDRALAGRPDHPFVLEWHPYQLNPDMPAGGMARADYMAAKFGSPEAIARVHEPLVAHAARIGLPLDLAAIRVSPNTLDAHRLIHWAGLEGRQTPVVGALFHAYWAEGRDVGDHATLAEIAGACGLDAAMIARLLSGSGDADDIGARAAHAQERGVTGVPTFILAQRYVLQGAQPAETWSGIIDELAAKGAPGAGA